MSPLTLSAPLIERTLTIGPESCPYVAVRGGDSAYRDLAARARALAPDRWILVTDMGVPGETRKLVTGCLGDVAPVTTIVTARGELDKTPGTVTGIASTAIGAGATRATCVVGLGGGKAGNLAGLAAGQLYRGSVRLVHTPTTFLAASDSVISRKQAVNCGAKNTAGVFKMASLVWVNFDFFTSLPPREFTSGMCEAVKNAVAVDPGQAPEIREILARKARYSDGSLARLITLCFDAKQRVLRDDPAEEGPGLALEWGHTAGHALEPLAKLGHGIAIGIGGQVEARTARILGITRDDEVEDLHRDLLLRAGAPTAVPRGLSHEALLQAMRRDNKRGYLPAKNGHIDMVLLDAPGSPHHADDPRRPITQVPEAAVLQALRELEER